uniref:Uncharacterized protein n=1 Tax=Anguilla anguilla TaxID=7936 RepID=A0A0E9U506_ANGAN
MGLKGSKSMLTFSPFLPLSLWCHSTPPVH